MTFHPAVVKKRAKFSPPFAKKFEIISGHKKKPPPKGEGLVNTTFAQRSTAFEFDINTVFISGNEL